MKNLVQILADNIKRDRISIPLIKTLEVIFERQEFEDQLDVKELFSIIQTMISTTQNMNKLLNSCGVLNQILFYADVFYI